MKKLITILSITTAALMLSSCIIVGTDRDPNVVIEKPSTSSSSSSSNSSSSNNSTTQTSTSTPVVKKYSITCKNETSYPITDWCVQKDNIVTYANSTYNRGIRAGGEDMISDLPEGYYKVYFSFEEDHQLNPNDYYSSESIYLNKDVTYCLYERQITVSAECRTAGAKESVEKQLYLSGSDGTEIILTNK